MDVHRYVSEGVCPGKNRPGNHGVLGAKCSLAYGNPPQPNITSSRFVVKLFFFLRLILHIAWKIGTVC